MARVCAACREPAAECVCPWDDPEPAGGTPEDDDGEDEA